MAINERIAALKDFIRQPHAFPGGYPKILVMSDGETMPFYMQQIWLLNSFNEAICSADDGPIRKLNFINTKGR